MEVEVKGGGARGVGGNVGRDRVVEPANASVGVTAVTIVVAHHWPDSGPRLILLIVALEPKVGMLRLPVWPQAVAVERDLTLTALHNKGLVSEDPVAMEAPQPPRG